MKSLFSRSTGPTFVLAGLLALGGCATPGPGISSGQKMVMTELYFGSSKGTGGTVTEKEWRAFLNTEITPRFPDGLTILDGHGQWRSPDGNTTRENTKVLVLVHPPSGEDTARLETIRNLYKQRYHQESVLKVTSPVRVSF